MHDAGWVDGPVLDFFGVDLRRIFPKYLNRNYLNSISTLELSERYPNLSGRFVDFDRIFRERTERICKGNRHETEGPLAGR